MNVDLNSPYNDDTLSLKNLLSNDTGEASDQMTTSINHYDFLEPHG